MPDKQAPRAHRRAGLRIVPAGVADAALVHRIMQAAFAEYRGVLDPPSGVLDESVADVARAIEQGGALLAWDGDTPVGATRYEPRPDCLYVGRVAVLPEHRRTGIATALMRRMIDVARGLGLPAIRVGVRDSLPSHVRLYESFGFVVDLVEQHPRGADKTVRMIQPMLSETRRTGHPGGPDT